MLLFVLVTLSCASANDINETDNTVAMDDTITEEITGAGEVGTFSELRTKINQTPVDEVVELTKDYTFNEDTDVMGYYNGVELNGNYVIDGKGHTLDGAKKSAIFIIERKNVTIKNIIFKNGCKTGGGAIWSEGGYTIIQNCTFINNEGSYGGAVEMYTGIVENCTFIKNNGTYHAGAIFYRTTATTNNCIFEDNVGKSGGAIYQQASGFIYNSIFRGNVANSGGALYCNPTVIENCTFTNNRVTNTGYKGTAAISIFNSVPKFTNCVFFNNTNYFYDSGMQSTSKDFDISYNSTFINCTFQSTPVTVKKGTKRVTSTFENCYFKNSGLTNRNETIYLSGNEFDGLYINNMGKIASDVYLEVPNYTQRIGGAYLLARLIDDSGNSIFDSNIKNYFKFIVDGTELNASSYDYTNGYWFFKTTKNLASGNYTVSIELTNQTEFEKHFRNYQVNSGLLRVASIGSYTQLQNDIASQGNTITLEKDYALYISLEAGFKDGILIDGDNIVIDGKGHTISGSSVARIFNITGNHVTLKNITFADGFAFDGGAIFASKDITIEDCKFINNKAVDGGALYLNDANIINCDFDHNQAHNGAVAYFANNVAVVNTTFENNVAKKGVIVIGNKLTLTNTTFKNNTLQDESVDIVLNDEAEVVLDNVTPSDIKVKFISEISIDAPSRMKYSDNVIITVHVTSYGKAINTGSVIFRINGTDYRKTVENGIVQLAMPILNVGKYDIIAIYDGGDKYSISEGTKKIEIEYASCYVNTEEQVEYYITQDGFFTFNATDDNGNIIKDGFGYLTVDIDNSNYIDIGFNDTDENGTIKIAVTSEILKNMPAGRYYAAANFYNQNYRFAYKYFTFRVNKDYALVTGTGASYVITYGGTYSLTLKDILGNGVAGKKVTFTLNGKNIGSATTNSKGVATIKLTASMLKAAKYGSKPLVITFAGDELYKSSSKTVPIKIQKEKTKITAKSKTYKKSLKVKKFTITLKNSKGKAIKKAKVTLKAHGKIYKAKTNNKGKATFKITNLVKKSKYLLKAKYKGNGNYKATSKKIKITVK